MLTSKKGTATTATTVTDSLTLEKTGQTAEKL
jgi:hypothetical protein